MGCRLSRNASTRLAPMQVIPPSPATAFQAERTASSCPLTSRGTCTIVPRHMMASKCPVAFSPVLSAGLLLGRASACCYSSSLPLPPPRPSARSPVGAGEQPPIGCVLPASRVCLLPGGLPARWMTGPGGCVHAGVLVVLALLQCLHALVWAGPGFSARMRPAHAPRPASDARSVLLLLLLPLLL